MPLLRPISSLGGAGQVAGQVAGRFVEAIDGYPLYAVGGGPQEGDGAVVEIAYTPRRLEALKQ